MKITVYTREIAETAKKPVVIYGAGAWGKLVWTGLRKWGIQPLAFADRQKLGTLCGLEIIDPKELAQYLHCHILICTPSAFREVTDYLGTLGFSEVFDVSELLRISDADGSNTNAHDLMPVREKLGKYEFFKRRSLGEMQEELQIPFLSLSVTERCSLKCIGCLAMVTRYEHPVDGKFDRDILALRRLTKMVGSIMEVGFVGGEVFMNPEFHRYLAWTINEDKVWGISVLTNGTILPDSKILELLKHPKVRLGIDDYGISSRKLDSLIAMAEREKIAYYIVKHQSWLDMGEPAYRGYDEKLKEDIFNHCSWKDCLLFLHGRLYRCQYGAHMVNLGLCSDANEDYVDFGPGEESADELSRRTRFLLSRTAPLRACGYCNDSRSAARISVAVQQAKSPVKH